MTDIQSHNSLNAYQNGMSKGILLETMQLVDERVDQPVPNHLLDSKIYAKLSQNATVKASPSTLYFAGFETGQVLSLPLRIGNVDAEVIRMHIIPPQSKYFKIKYKKQERLVPGMTLDCTVEFCPDEWRYYYDCIRIHTKGDENLIIPIHAYPILDTSTFPQILTFPATPVGHKKSKIIPLRCDVPIDFEFQLVYLQPHSAFTIEPMTGVIPANGEVEITVTYSPVEFSTSRMICQLNISQFNFKPVICTCTGTSTPGLARELAEKTIVKETSIVQAMEDTLNILDPRAISPLDRSRLKKKTVSKKKIKNGFTQSVPSKKEIEIEGIHFPPDLNTPHAVAQVLNQIPGKLRAKDYREAMNKKDMETSSRQMKEAIFDHAVKKDVYEERQNQLRWQVRLGEVQITAAKKEDVLNKRSDAWDLYRLKRGDPVLNEEYERTCSRCLFRRTVRDSQALADGDAQFDTYTNNPWAQRHSALNKFAQAGRTVILRLRADKKIKGIRQMVLQWKKKKLTSSANESVGGEDGENEKPVKMSSISADKIQSVQFPHYASPNVKDDMAPDALGLVPVESKEVVIKKNVYYGELVVPKQYKLLSYQPHSVHESSHGYVPFQLVKKLRTGAEDEVIALETKVPSVLPATDQSERPDTNPPVNEGDMVVSDILDEKPVPPPVVQILELTPPEALFKPIEYPPLHIFNPAPGLQVFQAPLSYAEVDPDYHLCPLPRYPKKESDNQPHSSTQKQYLEREDVVKGVMTWKKFPSQGLTSLSNTPTLSNVWVPRWSDPFNSDLLPTDVPHLLDALPEEDRENIYEEAVEGEDGENLTKSEPIQLTPEMVNAMFPSVSDAVVTEEKQSSDMFPNGNKMPATNIPVSNIGPVPREKREQEIDFFLNKKYNKLGQKIQGRVDMMNSFTTMDDLELK